jgi:hypothetical protein
MREDIARRDYIGRVGEDCVEAVEDCQVETLGGTDAAPRETLRRRESE